MATSGLDTWGWSPVWSSTVVLRSSAASSGTAAASTVDASGEADWRRHVWTGQRSEHHPLSRFCCCCVPSSPLVFPSPPPDLLLLPPYRQKNPTAPEPFPDFHQPLAPPPPPHGGRSLHRWTSRCPHHWPLTLRQKKRFRLLPLTSRFSRVWRWRGQRADGSSPAAGSEFTPSSSVVSLSRMVFTPSSSSSSLHTVSAFDLFIEAEPFVWCLPLRGWSLRTHTHRVISYYFIFIVFDLQW